MNVDQFANLFNLIGDLFAIMGVLIALYWGIRIKEWIQDKQWKRDMAYSTSYKRKLNSERRSYSLAKRRRIA